MGGHRLSGTHWTNLIGGVIANSKDEIELGRVRFREFLPTFAAKTTHWNVGDFKLPQSLWAHSARRVTARTVRGKLRATLEVHDPLSHDRTRRVTRTQEQHVVMWLHDFRSVATGRSAAGFCCR